MLTTIDKALAAVITPIVVYYASSFLPAELATPEFKTAISGLVTAGVVWLVPNKQPS